MIKEIYAEITISQKKNFKHDPYSLQANNIKWPYQV